MLADPSRGVDPGQPITEQEALARLRQQEDPGQRYYAAWWLGRMRSRHPDAVPLLIDALAVRGTAVDSAAGVNEPNAIARNAARALGKLADAAAVPALLTALEDPDDGLREAAARSLGELGAIEARRPISRRLATGPEWAGSVQPGSSRLQEPCEALLEALGMIGLAGEDNPDTLLALARPYVDHGRPLIRAAACRCLFQLSGETHWVEQLRALLLHEQLQVRRAALMDLAATGWRPAGPAIAGTLAENSLKLIALRGLVEQSPEHDPQATWPSAAEIDLLNAMDALL